METNSPPRSGRFELLFFNFILLFHCLPHPFNQFVGDVPETRGERLDVLACRVLFTSSCKFSENLGCTTDRKGADQLPLSLG